MTPHPQPQRPSENPEFDEHELIFFFTEIISKTRARLQAASFPTASQILFQFIQDRRIEPPWEDIALPNGRSLASCKFEFHGFPQRAPPPPGQLSIPSSSTTQKRPYQAIESQQQSSGARTLAPKPAPAPTGAQRSFQSASLAPSAQSPLAGTFTSLGEPRKKRGRPSKKEIEAKRQMLTEPSRPISSQQGAGIPLASPPIAGPGQHAMSMGFDPPTSPITGMPTGQLTFTPQGGNRDTSTSGSSGSKKRGRPRKTPTAIPPQQPTFASAETPPQTALRERRESTTETSRPSLPPIQEQRAAPGASEGEESKQPVSDWKNTMLNQ